MVTEERSGRWHFCIQEYTGESASAITPERFRCCQDGRCSGWPNKDSALRAGEAIKRLPGPPANWDIPGKTCSICGYLAKLFPDHEIVPLPLGDLAGSVKVQLYSAGSQAEMQISRKFLDDHRDARSIVDFFDRKGLKGIMDAAGPKPILVHDDITILQ